MDRGNYLKELKFSDFCAGCKNSLAEVEKVFFVEKEVGRCFCSETCIVDYFRPKVEELAEELQKLRQGFDFQAVDHTRFRHYQPLTLEDPDEIWVLEKKSQEVNDKYFCFISRFQKGESSFHYIVVTLAIEGVPSFILQSFPTKDEDLVDYFRQGTLIKTELTPDEELEKAVEEFLDEDSSKISASDVFEENQKEAQRKQEEENSSSTDTSEAPLEGESAIQKLYRNLRKPNDIPISDFHKYEAFVDLSLEDPNEIWKYIDAEANEFYTFISRISFVESDGSSGLADDFFMVVVCEAVFDADKRVKTLEPVFAFPTLDAGLVQHFKKGINTLNKTYNKGPSWGMAA
jgi:hypothetical protein